MARTSVALSAVECAHPSDGGAGVEEPEKHLTDTEEGGANKKLTADSCDVGGSVLVRSFDEREGAVQYQAEQ